MAWILSLYNASIPFHPSCTTACQIARRLGYVMARSRPSCLAIIAIALLVGCAPLRTLPPAKPISQDQAHHLIKQMRVYADEVFSFVGVGKLLFREGVGETDLSSPIPGGSRSFTS